MSQIAIVKGSKMKKGPTLRLLFYYQVVDISIQISTTIDMAQKVIDQCVFAELMSLFLLYS